MKKFLISALMLLATLSASAQLISAARDNSGVRFGVKGSFAMSNMNQDAEHSLGGTLVGYSFTSKQLPAFAVGVAMDLPVLQSFHFNMELKYVMKGQKAIANANLLGLNYETISVDRIGYLELPIQPQFRLNLNKNTHVNVNLGPYFGLALHGHNKTKAHVEGTDDIVYKNYIFTGRSFVKDGDNSRIWESAPDSYKSPYSRFDVGLAMGVEFVIEHFHIGVSYDLGLKDIDVNARDKKNKPGYNPTKNRTALFTLGVDF